ncbi:hypothetical protein BurJ1DRAFT_0122 [Burkholderiales bacterium JOSHI_001]|nr:hypothetical protein BurJ1DRAFT_0122 [Burkholderiales bacterium JOSHI_001]
MGAIFISYRREDADGHAGRLFQNLCVEFGTDSVFMDVVGIDPGVDFRKIIDAKLKACSVLLAVMGKQWLDLKNPAGQRRLDDDNDFVRLETAAALRRDIHVIPVLVQGARMPNAAELPDDLKDLAYRNGVELTHARWDSDVGVLVQALAKIVRTPSAAAKTAAAPDAAARSPDKGTPVLPDGPAMPPERRAQDGPRNKPGPAPDPASAIEAQRLDYQRRLAQYRQELSKTIAQGYPLSEPARAGLRKRRADLDLKAEDADRIDRELLDAAETAAKAQAEAEKQARRQEREAIEEKRQQAKAARRLEEAAAQEAERQRLSQAPPKPAAAAPPPAEPQRAPPAPPPAPSPLPASVTSAGLGMELGERLAVGAVGAVTWALGMGIPLAFGASGESSHVLGGAIWGAVVGTIGSSYRWTLGLAVLVGAIGLLSTLAK